MRNLFIYLCVSCWLSSALAIPAQGHKILISGPTPWAVEAGKRIAQMGGNAVDVAVSIGLALSVTSPYYAALGGGGFALVKMNGSKLQEGESSVQALDFRETAPAAAGKDYFLKLPKNASQDGAHAVGVPGFPAGLWALHQRYGKLKWSQLFALPLELAQKGFPVTTEWVRETSEEKDRFNEAGLKIFLKKNKVSYKPGEILRQRELAQALEKFKSEGPKGFYEGAVAQDVVLAIRTGGGKMTLEDLKNYKVRWLTPLTTQYEGHTLHLMPPPSSGGIVIKSGLALIEKLNVKATPLLSVDEFHLLAEIESRAFRGRSYLGDPDFARNPLAFLSSEKYLQELAQSVNRKKAVALKPLDPKSIYESVETTHFSVLDSEGNAVALTVTLNGGYGSGVVSPQFGIALNNEMDDFTTRPNEPNLYGLIQGEENSVAGGKRPLSSMSPTLVEKDGKIIMAIGSPGGPRIISGVLQVLYRILGRGMDSDSAIQAPRVHHQFLPNVVYVDRDRFSPEVVKMLEDRGHKVKPDWMGKVYVVRITADGLLEGAFDARGEGAAGGI